ncbi:hypothetical protein [Leekyejoonella antrihumi]|uniref:Uncharacterized protein n=1 Tax=Leekyejoonella antrihumi TaxID=1660198 RepID=A0A563DW80_9MICO|nr:hypothetical protein [Leekyejoonella antrihumi]TWP34369.1 hypothetical protein FGL98_17460 [Leekyejoonella antrihumi]
MTGLSTDPGALQVGARTMAAGGSSGLPVAVARALRAVAGAAGDPQLSETARRVAELWATELADLDECGQWFAAGLHTAGQTYAAAEAAVVASVRRS